GRALPRNDRHERPPRSRSHHRGLLRAARARSARSRVRRRPARHPWDPAAARLLAVAPTGAASARPCPLARRRRPRDREPMDADRPRPWSWRRSGIVTHADAECLPIAALRLLHRALDRLERDADDRALGRRERTEPVTEWRQASRSA